MLLSCITHLRLQGQEWRNVKVYGQVRNLMTSSIARMNCFLHGIEDFQIVRGDTSPSPSSSRAIGSCNSMLSWPIRLIP
jgi:type I restriction enzyme M protein